MFRPSSRLVGVWLALMALSGALAVVADTRRSSPLGLAWIALVGAVAFVKARLVLADYLGLRATPAALAGFSAAVLTILAIVVLPFFAPAQLFARP